MKRTAQSIEEAKEARRSEKKPQTRHKTGFRGPSPDVGKATQWKKGQSGNPGGKPKHDFAAEIARAVFENNPNAIRAALEKALLKGNAYVFKELADRGYGKLTDKQDWNVTVNIADIISRIRQREANATKR
jgi:hypothetical protein